MNFPGVARVRRHASRFLAVCFFAAGLAACSERLDWREFQSAEGRFSVALPGRALHDKRTLSTPAGTVVMNMDSVNVGKSMFGVGYADYPAEYLQRVKPDAIIASVRDSLVRNIGGRNATESPLARGGFQGRNLHAEGRIGKQIVNLDALLVFSGGRFYQVVAIGEAGQIGRDALDLYFNSFKIAQ